MLAFTVSKAVLMSIELNAAEIRDCEILPSRYLAIRSYGQTFSSGYAFPSRLMAVLLPGGAYPIGLAGSIIASTPANAVMYAIVMW